MVLKLGIVFTLYFRHRITVVICVKTEYGVEFRSKFGEQGTIQNPENNLNI